MTDCTHPSEMLAWNDERPLYCTLCDADLQAVQPVKIVEMGGVAPHPYQSDDELGLSVCDVCGAPADKPQHIDGRADA